jgi:pectate lyase
MSTKNICLALVALVLTAGAGTAAEAAHRNLVQQAAATLPAACTTSYSTETGANGQSVSVANVTCSRSALRMAGGAAL